MKQFIVLLFLLATLWGDTPLDLFVDGSSISTSGGHYNAFSDNDDGGASTITVQNISGRDSTSDPIQFSYSLDRADYEWEPFVELQLSLDIDSFMNFSPYQAIRYSYKGSAHTFLVKSTTVEDWAFHERSLSESKQWREVTIPLPTGVYQPDWGKSVPLNLKEILAVAWHITGDDKESGEFSIKEVTLVDTFTITKHHDLILRDAQVPTKETLEPFKGIRNPLQKKAQKYLNKGVSLHNWLEENAPFVDFRYTKDDIIRFKHQGFEGIRFPIDLDLYVIDKKEVIAGTKPLILDTLIWTPLDSLEAWTKELGLSLTIDYHQYDASLTNSTVFDKGYRAMAAGVWKKVAFHFKDNKREDIFYELTNEPGISGEVSRKGWRELSEEMIDSIRSVDTQRTLIWGDSRWYEIEQLIKNKPFEEQNIIYSFHYYEPFLFTHQGASWTGMGSTKNTPFPYKKELWNSEYEYFGIQEGTPDWIKDQYQEYYKMGNRNAMYNQVVVAKRWADHYNVALINNEFGAHPKVAKPEHLTAYFATICSIFEELEIPWQLWFGAVDDEGELLPGMKKALDLR